MSGGSGSSPPARRATEILLPAIAVGCPAAAVLHRQPDAQLRFYFLLSQLDVRRQRFFTASQTRTAGFYEVFRDSDQVERKIGRRFGTASIEDLFREIP